MNTQGDTVRKGCELGMTSSKAHVLVMKDDQMRRPPGDLLQSGNWPMWTDGMRTESGPRDSPQSCYRKIAKRWSRFRLLQGKC